MTNQNNSNNTRIKSIQSSNEGNNNINSNPSTLPLILKAFLSPQLNLFRLNLMKLLLLIKW